MKLVIELVRLFIINIIGLIGKILISDERQNLCLYLDPQYIGSICLN